jgi:hypothetical protein
MRVLGLAYFDGNAYANKNQEKNSGHSLVEVRHGIPVSNLILRLRPMRELATGLLLPFIL